MMKPTTSTTREVERRVLQALQDRKPVSATDFPTCLIGHHRHAHPQRGLACWTRKLSSAWTSPLGPHRLAGGWWKGGGRRLEGRRRPRPSAAGEQARHRTRSLGRAAAAAAALDWRGKAGGGESWVEASSALLSSQSRLARRSSGDDEGGCASPDPPVRVAGGPGQDAGKSRRRARTGQVPGPSAVCLYDSIHRGRDGRGGGVGGRRRARRKRRSSSEGPGCGGGGEKDPSAWEQEHGTDMRARDDGLLFSRGRDDVEAQVAEKKRKQH